MVAIYTILKQRCLGLGLIDPNFLKLFEQMDWNSASEDS